MALVKKRRDVVVTGVAGFIGSNLAERLCGEGFRVRGIDNLAYGLRSQIPRGVDFYKTDIRSKKCARLFSGIDTVFHLAAKNCIADCQADPVETADTNVTGTIKVLEACRAAKVRKLVYAESSAVYEGSSRFPTPESRVAEKPVSFYACSKLAAGIFARRYCAYHRMRVTGLRYFNVYGPRQDYRRSIPPVMSAFIIALLKGRRPVIYGTGKRRRDFIYIDDVNDFHLLAMRDSRTDGEVFNLGTGMAYSVKEIFELIRGLLGSTIKPCYRKSLPAEAEATLADIRKAKSLGWSPRVPIEEGLRASIAYIRSIVLARL